MTKLNQRESELVALGAAMGSNCSPCIEYHIPVARKAGLSDEEIGAAIDLADKVRQVTAKKTLNTAQELLGKDASASQDKAEDAGCCCTG